MGGYAHTHTPVHMSKNTLGMRSWGGIETWMYNHVLVYCSIPLYL